MREKVIISSFGWREKEKGRRELLRKKRDKTKKERKSRVRRIHKFSKFILGKRDR
jgi:hypothetical protein